MLLLERMRQQQSEKSKQSRASVAAALPRRARRVVGPLAAVGLVAGIVAACVQLEGSLGADCLKGQDCQSGICSQLHCAAAPPLLDADLASDGAPDAAAEAAPGEGGISMGGDATEPNEASEAGELNDTGSSPGLDTSAPPTDTGAPTIDAPADAVDEHPVPDAAVDALPPTVDAAEAG
jgi:hypothetical protein